MKNKIGFCAAEILLPDFEVTDGTRWATVACDQYTSEPNYWKAVEQTVGEAPSTLRMILPEVYLSEATARIGAINRQMEIYLTTVLKSYPNAMICLSRTQSDGAVRRGIIGAVDLECYDYNKGATSLTRATEGTVLERIPPRVEIRRDAALEMPHIMLLIDDPDRSVIEPTVASCASREPIYDFELMQGGGHVRAHLMTEAEQHAVIEALSALATTEAMKARYGEGADSTLLFAVGDGNHSLATAKAVYEQIKASIGEEAAKQHPARYALAEVVNLHDDALQFEPIYRVVFGCNPNALLEDLKAYLACLSGNAAPQTLRCILQQEEFDLTAEHPALQLTVGTLQAFLFDYTEKHPEVEVDYIHGEDSLRSLVNRPDVVGFLFDGMEKGDLFRTVLFDGALPRKTFSMGHADDKRYYIECRKIK